MKFITACLISLLALSAQAAELGPQPGNVYREFHVNTKGNKGWRVTDPGARAQDARAFLPNPVHEFQIDDLKDAVRAEAVIDRWGGHPNTANKRVRFNGGDWILVPELSTTPSDKQPETYLFQDNPVIEVSLDQLKEGLNTLEGTCGVINNDNWGQWGMYSVNVRVYYDPAKKPHATAELSSPAKDAVLTENPSITVKTTNDAAIQRIDCIGNYRDYDIDGDGLDKEWIESWRQPDKDTAAVINHHVGTVTKAPYEFTWNTEWVPDQDPGAISFVARVQDAAGMWYVTEPVTGLTLERKNISVRMFSATYIPQRFGVRTGGVRVAVIPIADNAKFGKAKDAKIVLNTWNGFDEEHEPLKLNDWSSEVGGKNHFYSYNEHDVPLDVLRKGDNVVTFTSQTKHHHLEVLWPGPALKMRFDTSESASKPKAEKAASKPKAEKEAKQAKKKKAE